MNHKVAITFQNPFVDHFKLRNTEEEYVVECFQYHFQLQNINTAYFRLFLLTLFQHLLNRMYSLQLVIQLQ